MYVGITRARRYLTITHAKKRARHGRRVECMPSRFLFELKGEKPPRGWKAGGKPPAPRRRARAAR
jgi:ATP-dependent DNA helicase Rep